MGSGIDKKDLSVSIYDVLMGEKSIEEATLSLENTQYDLLPSNSDLTGAEVGLLNITNREIQLRKEVEKIRDKYAYIIIDCPPSLNMLTVNALVAADSVVIPTQCEYYALEGLSALLKQSKRLKVF